MGSWLLVEMLFKSCVKGPGGQRGRFILGAAVTDNLPPLLKVTEIHLLTLMEVRNENIEVSRDQTFRHLDLKFSGKFTIVLGRISIAGKRHHHHRNSYKGKHLIEVEAYNFRELVHCHHGGI